VSLKVTRLLASPLGEIAPEGEPGDIVCVDDGRVKVYLSPEEYAEANEQHLRELLAERLAERRRHNGARALPRPAPRRNWGPVQ
jgi:ribosomal protein L9